VGGNEEFYSFDGDDVNINNVEKIIE